MPYSPVLTLHIAAGIMGILSGTAAMSFRKGSPRHALAGKVFVSSMLIMAAAAVYLTVIKHQNDNIGGGILTFYLILTTWLTANRRDGETSRYDWVMILIPSGLGFLPGSVAYEWCRLDRKKALFRLPWPFSWVPFCFCLPRATFACCCGAAFLALSAS